MFSCFFTWSLCDWAFGSCAVENGYRGVVVAVSPEEAEDPALVEAIKELFTSASAELYGGAADSLGREHRHVIGLKLSKCP